MVNGVSVSRNRLACRLPWSRTAHPVPEECVRVSARSRYGVGLNAHRPGGWVREGTETACGSFSSVIIASLSMDRPHEWNLWGDPHRAGRNRDVENPPGSCPLRVAGPP